jgi:hypothetical protein
MVFLLMSLWLLYGMLTVNSEKCILAFYFMAGFGHLLEMEPRQ